MEQGVNVVEVTVSESRKINIGNYESRDIFYSLKADASNLEVDKVHDFLQRKITKKLDEQENEIIKSIQANQK